MFCSGCGQRLVGESPTASSRPPTPTAIAERYRVEDLLGEGARKRVYRAYDTRLDRAVALAIFKTEGIDEADRARLQREARAMGRLGDHANIVTVYDVADDGEISYIVTELLAGGDLAQQLRGAENGMLPVDDAVAIADQIALALAHAHEHGIVHRDLKPSNVWLADDGTVRLGDFGLAVALDRSRLTSEGMIVGTVAYLAPEQAIGRVPDTRSDLYSLGALLYELVTGRPPFVGDDAVSVISQHLHTAPVAPSWHNPEVNAALEQVIMTLLAKAPDDRLPDAAAVREALRLARSTTSPDANAGANPLDRLAGGVFVGRDDEVASMRTAFDDALSGRGRLVLLTGEPGIGKTRTADELSTYARLRGAQVLWGRCHEGDGAPAYWPWVQLVRAYAHDRDPSDLRSELGTGASVIAQIVPELGEHLPDLAPAAPLDPDEARFRLFDSITTFLKNASQRQPLVLILDDVHWADEPSLLLLRHLATELAVGRLLVLVTYRDVELRRHHPLAGTLGELARHAVTQRVTLRGLARDDVARYIEIVTARTPPTGLVDAVYLETEGNPFFVAEVVRLLASEGRIDEPAARWSVSIPQGVREVVGRRLEQLGGRVNDVLGAGAVIGREFTLSVLAAVDGGEEDEIAEALDTAVGARILEPDQRGATYRFSHALIRETLYDELTQGRRIRLHRRIAAVLEALPREPDQAALAELAHHFSRAAPGGDIDKAVEYATRAAAAADAALAYEEAARLYRLALDDVELVQPPDERVRFDLLMALGAACRRAASIDDARSAFRSAVEIAARLGDVAAMGEATLGFARPGLVAGLGDLELIELLESTLARHDEGNTALKVRLLARLAMELAFVDLDRQAAAAEQALEVATAVGDPRGLAFAKFVSSYRLYSQQTHLGQLEDAVDLAEGAGDRELANLARLHLVTGYWWFGQVENARAGIEQFQAAASELRQPFFDWHARWFSTAIALDEGRFDEGLALAQEAFEFGSRVSRNDALQGLTYQQFVARRSRADVEALIDPIEEVLEAVPTMRAWRALRALIAVELGEDAHAAALIDEMADPDHLQFAHDPFEVPAVAVAAEVCWHLRMPERCRDIYALLRGEEVSTVIFGAFAALLGSKARYLGIAAAGAGQFDEAIDHLRQALDEQAALGSRPWNARTHLDLARALVGRGGTDDRDRALAHASEAVERGRELGMNHFVDQAIAFKLATQGHVSSSDGGSIHAMAAAAVADRPDMLALVPTAQPGGTVTILFTDIESSTALAEQVGDQRWLAILRAHNTAVRRVVQAHGGTEVKARGDGFMLAFSSARQAVRCAIAVQAELHRVPIAVDGGHVRVRIGLHTGEALQAERDYFGRHVNLAARIADAAAGTEILVSSLTRDLLSGDDIAFGTPRRVVLKGITGDQEVVPVTWQQRARPSSVADDMEQAVSEEEDQPHAST